MKTPETVEDLGLSFRTSNCLRKAWIGSVADLVQMTTMRLLITENLGANSITEIRGRLAAFGLVLADYPNAAAINAAAFSTADESSENPGPAAAPIDIEVALSASGTVPSEVNELGLGVRPSNCLRRAGIHLVSELIELPAWKLLDLPNFGATSLAEIQERLDEFGLVLADHPNAAAINAATMQAVLHAEEGAALRGIQHLAAWGLANNYDTLPAIIVDAAAGFVDAFPYDHYERLHVGLTGTTVYSIGELNNMGILEGDEASAADLEAIETLASLQTAAAWGPSNGYDTLEELLQDADNFLVDSDEPQEALVKIASARLDVLGEPYVAAYDWRIRIADLINQSGKADQYWTIVEGRWTGHAPAIIEGQLSGYRQTLEEVGLELSLTRERVRQLEAKLRELLLSDPVIEASALRLSLVIGDFLSVPMLNAAGFEIESCEGRALLELASLASGYRGGTFALVSAWDDKWISRERQSVEDLATNEFWATAVEEVADFETVLLAIARKLLERGTSLTETGIAGRLVEAFGKSELSGPGLLPTDNPNEPSIVEDQPEAPPSTSLKVTIGSPVPAGRQPRRVGGQEVVASDGPGRALWERAKAIVDSDQSLHRRSTHLLLWTGSFADKGVRVLRAEGRPMHRTTLSDEVRGKGNARGALTQIQGDTRVCRQKKNLYGLTEWGAGEYRGIVSHMIDSIENSGGRIAVWELQQVLREEWGINSDSVSMHASENPRFFRGGDFVRLRRKTDQLDVKPLGECHNIVRIGDRPSSAHWAWRLQLTKGDWFRGAGMHFPQPFALHLGLTPGEEGELRCGARRIGWYWNDQINASISNTPELRELVAGAEDQYLLVVAMGPTKVKLRLLDCFADDASALSNLLGVVGADPDSTNPVGALAFAIGLDRRSDLTTVAKQMRQRTKRARTSPEKTLFAEAFPGVLPDPKSHR